MSKKVSTAQWLRMTTADQIRARGPQYTTTTPVGFPTFPDLYRVEATVGGDGYGGACSFFGGTSIGEALAVLERERARPENAKYTHWDVLRQTPASRIDLIEPEDYEIERLRNRT